MTTNPPTETVSEMCSECQLLNGFHTMYCIHYNHKNDNCECGEKVKPTVEKWERDVREVLDYHEAQFGTCGNSATKKEVKNSCVRELAKLLSLSVQEAKAEERGIVTDIIKKWVMKTGVTARITTPDTEVVNATELHKLLHSLNVKASLKQEEDK